MQQTLPQLGLGSSDPCTPPYQLIDASAATAADIITAQYEDIFKQQSPLLADFQQQSAVLQLLPQQVVQQQEEWGQEQQPEQQQLQEWEQQQQQQLQEREQQQPQRREQQQPQRQQQQQQNEWQQQLQWEHGWTPLQGSGGTPALTPLAAQRQGDEGCTPPLGSPATPAPMPLAMQQQVGPRCPLHQWCDEQQPKRQVQQQWEQSRLGLWGLRQMIGLRRLQPASGEFMDGVRLLYLNMMVYVQKVRPAGLDPTL